MRRYIETKANAHTERETGQYQQPEMSPIARFPHGVSVRRLIVCGFCSIVVCEYSNMELSQALRLRGLLDPTTPDRRLVNSSWVKCAESAQCASRKTRHMSHRLLHGRSYSGPNDALTQENNAVHVKS